MDKERPQDKKKQAGKGARKSIAGSGIWLAVASSFVLLCGLLFLSEILDLPHILLGAPRTPINWYEAIGETVVIVIIGLFTISRLVHNITKRKRAEEELKESQDRAIRQEKLAVLGQLAGGVGHELRNPLGVISNAVYYLITILPDANKTTKEYLELISSEVNKSEKIISGLLDLSRTKPSDREAIAVSELVRRALEKHPPPEKVVVNMELSPDVPPLFVDPLQIGQVLDNLVANAYQAMHEGGRLIIKAGCEKGKVHISVTDTGSGISGENMEKIFEPLFTTRTRGIGLGLTVTRNLVMANGGSITVKSPSEEGKGSTFTVTLPIKGG